MQTAVFMTLGLAQISLALAVRAPRRGVALAHRGLEAAVLLAAGLQVMAVAWAPLRELLGTETLPFSALVAVAAFAAVPGLAAVHGRVVLQRGEGPTS